MPWWCFPEFRKLGYLSAPLHSNLLTLLNLIQLEELNLEKFARLSLFESFLLVVIGIVSSYRAINDSSTRGARLLGVEQYITALDSALIKGEGKATSSSV